MRTEITITYDEYIQLQKEKDAVIFSELWNRELQDPTPVMDLLRKVGIDPLGLFVQYSINQVDHTVTLWEVTP